MVTASRLGPSRWPPPPGHTATTSRFFHAARPGQLVRTPTAAAAASRTGPAVLGAGAAAGAAAGALCHRSHGGRARAHRRQSAASIVSRGAAADEASAGVKPLPGAAVVKIFVTRQRASMTVPWQAQQVESTSGSGTLIRRRGTAPEDDSSAASTEEVGVARLPPYWEFTEIEQAIPKSEGEIVLTAAHVVADARDVRVQLHARGGVSQDRYPATVVAIAHDCDLALLEVTDPRCFQDVDPMRLFGPKELLDVQSKVQVMGFPIGGDYLSITEGILSRVEVVEYSHSRRPCLALTVDAAVNAGNSGGPVVDPASGRMLAVAHQKVVAAGVENQGHAVPAALLWRFLYGQAHGKPSPMPSIGAFLQTLESVAHREQLGLKAGETGVLVREVNRGPRDGPLQLQAGDVLMQVGNCRVDNFSSVELLGHRVALSAVQDLWYLCDCAYLRVRRAGQDLDLEAELRPSTHLVPRSLYGGEVTTRLDFAICGGLVFVPLTADFLEQAWPNAQDRPAHLMDLFYRAAVTPEKSEAVILLSILADDVNAGNGAGYVGCPIVERVCGKPVGCLEDLAVQLRRAMAEEEFILIDFTMASGPYTTVLKSADIPEADARIAELYQLPALTSLPA